MDYKYITKNNLEDKQNYMYSEFGGEDFLQSYRSIRNAYIQERSSLTDEGVFHETRKELSELMTSLGYIDSSDEKSWQDTIDAYVKRFEVSKRLFTEYDGRWKPTKCADYKQFDIYLLLAECCLKVYKMTECIKYFSCLLKIDDTLLSVRDLMTDSEQDRLLHVLEEEIGEYKKLADKLGVEE